MNDSWMKRIGWVLGIFAAILVFNLNNVLVYQAETDVLLLTKSEQAASSLQAVAQDIRQLVLSLRFGDVIAENNAALSPAEELPNYQRKQFWDEKVSVDPIRGSGVIRIRNYDRDSTSARELNQDTVDNLIAQFGNYYDIQHDFELRVIDGPIVKNAASPELLVVVGKSFFWSLFAYLVIFYLLPFIFIKRDGPKRAVAQKLARPAIQSVQSSVDLPAEENYFSSQVFAVKPPKIQKAPFAPVGENRLYDSPVITPEKKAPIPDNLPVGDEELPDIFRQKTAAEGISSDKASIAKETYIPSGKAEQEKLEYVPREATPEEVKERLNKLLRGGK